MPRSDNKPEQSNTVATQDGEKQAPPPEELDLKPTRTELDSEGRIKNEQPQGTIRFNPQMATHRIVRRTDWPHDAMPEEGSADFVWEAGNGWTLPLDMFTDRQIQVLSNDEHFTISR